MINKRRRSPVGISVALTALFVFGRCGTPAPNGNGNRNGDTTRNEMLESCCSEGPPPGYVRVNKIWSPTTCGNPSDRQTLNYCTYQRYDNKPVDATMNICNDQAPPAGWEPAPDNTTKPDGAFWSPTQCGAPPMDSDNMLKIKRTS